MPEAQRRLEIFKFLYQAGWLEEAEKELDDLIKDEKNKNMGQKNRAKQALKKINER